MATLAQALQWLESKGTKKQREELKRYGIKAKKVFGVTMAMLLAEAKDIGKDQALSLGLWKSGWYEAKLLATLVGDPAKVTLKQMDAWAASFENWADADTACFKLFDQSSHAWKAAPKWADSPKEFIKRGGFSLMACLAAHDKKAADKDFLAFLPLIEKASTDERNFVKKSVNWALRMIGGRSPALDKPCKALAKRLALSKDPTQRWIGKDALAQWEKRSNL